MSNVKTSILQGLTEAMEYADGSNRQQCRVHVPEKVDVKEIRSKLHLTQREFAQKFGLPLDSVRNWEQQKRNPEGSARVLLTLIDRIPEDIAQALST